MPKISVIIPVYNAGKYIKKCILSVINQTLKDIEIIVVNDGSIDNSLKIINKLSKEYPNRLKIYTKENGGAGSARNLGLEKAKGEFIKFVDADDYLDKNILEKMYNIAKENNVSLVRGNYKTILGFIRIKDKCSWSDINYNKIVDVKKNKDYIVTETSGIGNKLIKRDLIGDLRFPESTKWEDLAIMPPIIASSNKLFHMDEPVYNYRVNMNTTIKDFIYKTPNILDILSCVENVENQMAVKGLKNQYREQMKSLFILHTLSRVENVMMWFNLSRKKKIIIVSSLLGILDKKYPDWQEDRMLKIYKTKNSLFKYNMQRLKKYIDDNYRNVNVEIAKKNIKDNLIIKER